MLLTAAIAVGVVFLGSLLGWCGYGLDLTDEGSYLNWIASPGDYAVSATQFGFVYHPLYELLGRDVVLLRQWNILAIFLLAWCLSVAVIEPLAAPALQGRTDERYLLYGTAFVLASASLVGFCQWLTTPSYNSLTLQGVLITAIGMTRAAPSVSRSSLLGSALIGAGGAIAFLAKPTTAAVLALTCLAYLAVTRFLAWRSLVLALGVAVLILCVTAWLVDGSLVAFTARLVQGAHEAAMLRKVYTLGGLLRPGRFPFVPRVMSETLVAAGWIFVAVRAGADGRRSPAMLWMSMTSALILGAAWLCATRDSLLPAVGRFQHLVLWGPALGGVSAAVALASGHVKVRARRDDLLLALFLAVTPHVYAFGGSPNSWSNALGASLFWCLSGAVVVGMLQRGGAAWRPLVTMAVATQTIVIALVNVGLHHPQRQPPLVANTESVRVGGGSSALTLSRETAGYLGQLKALAFEAGFRAGDPVVDLTGHSPGVLFALDAKATGLPWLLGGMPGSKALALAALDRTPCEELSRAWFLTEPGGPRSLDLDLRGRYGIDAAADLILVGSIRTPGSSQGGGREQGLLKPARSPDAARVACEGARAHR